MPPDISFQINIVGVNLCKFASVHFKQDSGRLSIIPLTVKDPFDFRANQTLADYKSGYFFSVIPEAMF